MDRCRCSRALPVERDPDVRDPAHELAVQVVLDERVRDAARVANRDVVADARGDGHLLDDLRVHLVGPDPVGRGGIGRAAYDRGRQPLDQRERRVAGDEPVEQLAGCEVFRWS